MVWPSPDSRTKVSILYLNVELMEFHLRMANNVLLLGGYVAVRTGDGNRSQKNCFRAPTQCKKEKRENHKYERKKLK